MSLILGIYKIVRKVGRGGFGEVYLVTDQEGKEWAVKEINKKKLGKNEKQYIYNEINIMKELDSDYIVKLHNTHENDDYIYIVLEYCNGRDLNKDMGKQPDKVYKLEETARILSDVIRGLEVIHTKGFLHRDLKIENILVKVDENDKKTYKVADFGLSKKSDRGQTVLGTGSYMSPEFYLEQEYGFEVDMWAFGVTMYFMLNKQYPFKLNPHLAESMNLQYQDLVKQAKDFSYSAFVNRSKFKLVENCTSEVENLFSRMFEINPNQRITFSEIRLHPIFRKFFPDQMNQQSQIMYKNRVKVKQIYNPSTTAVKKDVESENVELRQSLALDISATQKFPKQKEYLFHQNNTIQFLYNNFKEFKNVHGVLTVVQKMPLCYNLIKYYIILKRNFLQSIKNEKVGEHDKAYNFHEYFKTISFKKQYRQYEQQLDTAINEFETLHDQCNDSIDIINQINSRFKDSFHSKVTETDFVEPFKHSYRKSTLYVFNKLKKFLKQNNTGNKYNYFLALAVISHIFNRLFFEKQHLPKIFKGYLQQEKNLTGNIDYDKLREWMSKATPMQLNAVTRNIINQFFENS